MHTKDLDEDSGKTQGFFGEFFTLLTGTFFRLYGMKTWDRNWWWLCYILNKPKSKTNQSSKKATNQPKKKKKTTNHKKLKTYPCFITFLKLVKFQKDTTSLIKVFPSIVY